jgi:hypothetical protein
MRTAVATLESISPYSQSRYHNTPKLDRELPKDYEARIWRERLHTNGDGKVFIPAMTFKNCLDECAKYMSKQIPGKGKATYTKHFEAGVMVVDSLHLPFKKEDVQGEWLFLNSDGKRGGGTRVEKCYPVIPKWSGEVTFYVLDEIITPEVFLEHLNDAGNFIGIGRFRPRNRGFYGRFKVNGVKWS